MRTNTTTNQRGFTIIELMIATSVLATILIMVTAIMISIGNLYYKGVNQARVQDAARSIAESVSQDLELNDQAVSPTPVSTTKAGVTWYAICIGTVRYSYVKDVKIGDVKRDSSNNPSPSGGPTFYHVLWRDTTSSGCAPADLTSNTLSGGSELVPDNSRLTEFTVASTDPQGNGPYHVNLEVAYGDNDLLTGSGLSTLCKGSTGDQFCATALAQNVVAVKRLSQ